MYYYTIVGEIGGTSNIFFKLFIIDMCMGLDGKMGLCRQIGLNRPLRLLILTEHAQVQE